MDVSVILATFRRSDVLRRTLESFANLAAGDIAWELIVVDNADDAATQELLEECTGNLPLRHFVETRPGKNCALNKALEIARGELFIFTDDDVLVEPDWLTQMWQGSRRWPDFSLFGGKILPEFPKDMTPLYSEHPFYKSAYVIADWAIPEGPYGANKIWGPNMAISARVFEAGWKFNENIGPCGSNYVMGSESELLLRLEQAGFGAVYLRDSLVRHQIRPEQLCKRWLYQRAFRYGRSLARTGDRGSVACVFQVPRFLYRKILETSLKRILFCYRSSYRIDYGIRVWMLKGEIHQYRVTR